MSDRHRYVVTYDIADPKRLRHVFKTMKEFGQHTQYSVFVCDLDRTEYFRLQNALIDIVNTKRDRIMFVDVGPAASTAPRFTNLGLRPNLPDSTGPTIL